MPTGWLHDDSCFLDTILNTHSRCKACNLYRRTRTPSEWVASRDATSQYVGSAARCEGSRQPISQPADLFIQTARREHDAIFLHPNPGREEEVLRCIDLVREETGDEFFLMLHGDATYSIPDGDSMTQWCARAVERPLEVKQEAARHVDEALERGQRCATLTRMGLPDDLSGKRVLYVGCSDGSFSFKCERPRSTPCPQYIVAGETKGIPPFGDFARDLRRCLPQPAHRQAYLAGFDVEHLHVGRMTDSFAGKGEGPASKIDQQGIDHHLEILSLGK